MELECKISTAAFTSSHFYAVSWFYSKDDPSNPKVLVELDHNGLLKYPHVQGLGDLQGRLRLSRPTQSSFLLHIQRSHEEDGGSYQCQVEQYHLDNKGQWQQRAVERAKPVVLTVKVPGRTATFCDIDIHYCLETFLFYVGLHFNSIVMST